ALFQAQSGGGSGHDSGHDDDDDAYDCKTENIITFSKGTADTVRADLIALAPDGTELGIITNVKNGEELDVESRIKEFELEKKKKDHGRFEYDVEAPVPLLRVTGTKSGVTDVAYCGIMPYLDVIKPAGETISLSEGSSLDVKAFIPLVNVDTLGIKVDGIDVLAKLGINPVTAF